MDYATNLIVRKVIISTVCILKRGEKWGKVILEKDNREMIRDPPLIMDVIEYIVSSLANRERYKTAEH